MFEVVYHYMVIETDIPKLSSVWKKNIQRAIEEKLITRPDFYGKPLRQSLKGHRKLRVGDYRIIYRIEAKKVKIFTIRHRSVVYSAVEKRIGEEMPKTAI